MLTGGSRSIKEITRDLEQIPRQRRCVRIFHADQHAGEIAGCVEKLKLCMNGFLVSDDLSTLKIYLRLIAVTGGKRGNAGDQSRGAPGDLVALVSLLNVCAGNPNRDAGRISEHG